MTRLLEVVCLIMFWCNKIISNKSLIAEFYVLEKIAQAQCLGSILRLNVQAQYSGSMSKFFCAKKMLRLNVQAQCLSLMRLIYLVYFR